MDTESQKIPENRPPDSEQEVNDLLIATMDAVLADIRKDNPGLSIPPDVEQVLDDFVEFLPEDDYKATLEILEAAKTAQNGAPTPHLDHLISDIKDIRTQYMARSQRKQGLDALAHATKGIDLAKNAQDQKDRALATVSDLRSKIDLVESALPAGRKDELLQALADAETRLGVGDTATALDAINKMNQRIVSGVISAKQLATIEKLAAAIEADPTADAALKSDVNSALVDMVKDARNTAVAGLSDGTIQSLMGAYADVNKWLNDSATESYRRKIEADEVAARAAKATSTAAGGSPATPDTRLKPRSVQGIISHNLGVIPNMIGDAAYAAHKTELEALLADLQGAPKVNVDLNAAAAIAKRVKERVAELKNAVKGGDKLDPKLEEAKNRVLDAVRKRLATPKNVTEQEALEDFIQQLEHADAKGAKRLVGMYEQKGGLRISHAADPEIKQRINDRIDMLQGLGNDDVKIEEDLTEWKQELVTKHKAWEDKLLTPEQITKLDSRYGSPDRLRRAIELLDEKLGWMADDRAKATKPAKKGGKPVPGGPKPDVEGLVKALDDAAKTTLLDRVKAALAAWPTDKDHADVKAFLADYPGYEEVDANALAVRLQRDVKPATPPVRAAASSTLTPSPAPASTPTSTVASGAAPSAPAAPDARKARAEAERSERVAKFVDDTLMKGKTLDELKDMVASGKIGLGLTTAEEKVLKEYVDGLEKEPEKGSVIETVVAAYSPPFDVEGLKLLKQAVDDKKAKKPVSGMLKSLSLAELLDAIRRIEAIPKRSTVAQKPVLDPQDMGVPLKKPEAKVDTRTPDQKLAEELGVPVNSKGQVNESALDQAVASFGDRGGKLADLSPESRQQLRQRLGETIADLDANPARTPDEERLLADAKKTQAAILLAEKTPTLKDKAVESARDAGAKFMGVLKDAVRYHIHGETGESYKKNKDGDFERDANGDLIVEERGKLSKLALGVSSFIGNAVMIGTGTKLLPETVLTFTQSVFRSQAYTKSFGEMGAVMDAALEQAKQRRLENKKAREQEEEVQKLLREGGAVAADTREMKQAIADLDPAVMDKIRSILESNAYISLADKKRVRERMAQVLERHLKADIEDREGIQSEMKLLLDAGMEKRKNLMGVAKETVNSALFASRFFVPIPMPLRSLLRGGAYATMGAMEDRGRQQREQILSGEYKKDAVEVEKIGVRETLVEATYDYLRRLGGKKGTAEQGKAWAKAVLALGGAGFAAHATYDAVRSVVPGSWSAAAGDAAGDAAATIGRAFKSTGIPALFPGWGGGSGGDDNEMINEVNRRFMNRDLDRSLPADVGGATPTGPSEGADVRQIYSDLNAVRDGRPPEGGTDSGAATVDAVEPSPTLNVDVAPDGRPYAPINFETLDPKELTLVDRDNEHYGITQVLALQFERDAQAWGWDGIEDKRKWAVQRALELAMAADDWNPGDDQTHMTTSARDVIAIIPRHETMFNADGGNKEAIGYTFYNIQTKEVLTREQMFERGFATNPGYAENVLPKDIQSGQPIAPRVDVSPAPEASGGAPTPDLEPVAASSSPPDIQILSRFSTEPIGPSISASEVTPLPQAPEVAPDQAAEPRAAGTVETAIETPVAESPVVETGSASGRSVFEFSSLEGDKKVGDGYQLKTQGYPTFEVFERQGSDALYIDASAVIDNLSTQPTEQALLTQFASKHGFGENPARDEAYKELFVYVRLLLAMHKTGVQEPAVFDRLLKGFVEARSEALQAGAIPEFGQYSQPDNALAKLKVYMDRRLTEMESETSPRT